jgi:hypothetical protein
MWPCYMFIIAAVVLVWLVVRDHYATPGRQNGKSGNNAPPSQGRTPKQSRKGSGAPQSSRPLQQTQMERATVEALRRLRAEQQNKAKPPESTAADRPVWLDSDDDEVDAYEDTDQHSDSGASRRQRITHCWRCKSDLNSWHDSICASCRGIQCSCGACLCNSRRFRRYRRRR